MRTIRPITEEEMDDFITISANAYPGINIFGQEKRRAFKQRLTRIYRDPAVTFFALFEAEEMRGIMRLYDFTMNLLSTPALVGGVGGLAVDLLHKKEKVAADMVRFYLQHYKQKGACLAALYPFRPDFYRRMGFGYGTKRDLYRLPPASFPKSPGTAHLTFLSEKDRAAMQACYSRFMSRKHGLMERLDYVWQELINSANLQVVGVRRQNKITGYLMYEFKKGKHKHFLNNDLLIRELVYDSAEDLRELVRFLHTQDDQIDRVIYYTQDEFFHFLLKDPRNDSGNLLPQVYHETNTQGVGIMYRIINVPRLFEVLKEHNFGYASCKLKIVLQDSFFPENSGTYRVNFHNGLATMVDDKSHEVEMQLDVAEFSSLILGALNFKALHEYGLVTLSNHSYLDVLDRLFAAPKPLCYTEF